MDGTGFMYEDWLNALVREKGERESAASERACEAAIQGGKYGVLAIRTGGFLRYAEVCPLVPYGQIYVGNLPSPDGIVDWLSMMASRNSFLENPAPPGLDPQD